jgi:hypothetical protein
VGAEAVKVESLRELDALVAEHVMGWTLAKGRNHYGSPMGSNVANKLGTLAGMALSEVPRYSSTWDGAGVVAERMVERNYGKVHVSGSHYHGWYGWVTWDDDREHGSSASDVQPVWGACGPLAICLAALRAEGLEVELALEPSGVE